MAVDYSQGLFRGIFYISKTLTIFCVVLVGLLFVQETQYTMMHGDMLNASKTLFTLDDSLLAIETVLNNVHGLYNSYKFVTLKMH